jgi:endogenous inhibitor of DNA gyrase (YacG/DUF329 family)
MPCPICSRPAPPRTQNDAAPFCSARCKQIDLGNWLSDRYRVPGAGHGTDGAADVEDGYVNVDHEEGA